MQPCACQDIELVKKYVDLGLTIIDYHFKWDIHIYTPKVYTRHRAIVSRFYI